MPEIEVWKEQRQAIQTIADEIPLTPQPFYANTLRASKGAHTGWKREFMSTGQKTAV